MGSGCRLLGSIPMPRLPLQSPLPPWLPVKLQITPDHMFFYVHHLHLHLQVHWRNTLLSSSTTYSLKTLSDSTISTDCHKIVILFSGRQFDKDGNMMQWWNNATIRAFRERAQCIIDQYSRYKIDEVGMYMNGRMTQGENIADNGGLKQAFRVSF